ncbi:lytic transglycosylase domain-containing protein [Planosporangium thailandense]|uniref:Lytic transglycosylase domain-containing protein n=1 Tax=Planosporangium thailandense TaxID=765197 RepID=A0ABX0XU23_9ACTN|nr:lytic transglycosylase domain-containing protein [Planosporangium thailandense]NJC69501.1 lytic transglycosylase domain-containing protein [Planosporangium thailandense]
MVRLWHRLGGFRALSAVLLVAGVAAGAQLSTARQAQERMIKAAQIAAAERDDQRAAAAERQRILAVSRAAQRAAQAEADAAASAAASAAAASASASPSPQVKPSASPSASAKPSPSPFGPIPTSCSQYTGNVAIGCTLLLQAGYGLDQMPCLKNIWMKESGWRTTAGRTGGAYGIPQANPGSKMSSAGSDWQTNPATQIKWGLGYIKSKYGSPCGAWSYWQGHSYY